MMRLRHRMAIVLAGAASIALGASTIAHAQGAPPPIPPGNIPGAPKEAPKASPVIPDSVVGAPRETTPSKSEPRPKQPKPKPVARPKQPPRRTATDGAAGSRRAGHARGSATRRRAGREVRAAIRRRNTDRAAGRVERTRGCRLRRIPARPLPDRVHDRDGTRREARRRQGDGAARRALCRRPGREAGRDHGRRMVPARRRSRRPRRDVRARACCAWPAAPDRSIATRPRSCSPPRRGSSIRWRPTISRMLYLEGQLFPRDFARAAELFREAAEAGSAEAQYALATLYKEGRGVKRDIVESTRLLYLAAIADNPDAMVEYAIALFNGSGVAKNEEERRPLPACARRIAAARSRRTAWPISWRPGAGCPPTRWRRSSGT